MRIASVLTAALAGLLLMASAPSPEQVWEKGIADENKDYAQTAHAMLKIQDSAYLHDGDTTVLTGRKGDPASYHWSSDPKAQGVLRVELKAGKILVTKNGAAVAAGAIEKAVPIDADVDVVGHP